jgi:hypothetical protein
MGFLGIHVPAAAPMAAASVAAPLVAAAPVDHVCDKYTVYKRVSINIILSMLYKYNLIDAFINVFLESFGERKFYVSIMLKETMYMIFLSAHSEFKALTIGVEPCSSSKL